MLVTKKMGRSRARTVYKGLYNWPNETMVNNTIPLVLTTKEVQINKNESK